jgi:hypothetical protein
VAQVNVLTPITDHLRVGDAVFDKHAFLAGDIEEELVKLLFVVHLQRAQVRLKVVLQDNFFGELLDFKFRA